MENNHMQSETSESEETEGYRVWTVAEIMSHDFGEQDWLIENILPIETVNMLSGNPGNFKTWLTLDAAKAVSLGLPFLGHFNTTQGTVLIVDEEDHIRNLKKRLALMEIPTDAPIRFISQEGFKLGDEDDYEKFEEMKDRVKELQPTLIIFDSLVRIHNKDENTSHDMSNVMQAIAEFTKLGCTVLLTHHLRKQSGYAPSDSNQSARGSSDIIAFVDSHLTVRKVDNTLQISQPKLRVAESVEPFSVNIVKSEDNTKLGLIYGGPAKDKELNKDRAKEIIMEILTEGKHTRAELEPKILLSAPMGKSAIGLALAELEKSGAVLVDKGEKGKKSYQLPEDPAE